MARRPEGNRHLHETRGLTEIGWNNPELEEFEGYKKGDSIIWIDKKAKTTFSGPPFSYGNGPFEIQKMRADGNRAFFEVITAQGKTALVSSLYFKKFPGTTKS